MGDLDLKSLDIRTACLLVSRASDFRAQQLECSVKPESGMLMLSSWRKCHFRPSDAAVLCLKGIIILHYFLFFQVSFSLKAANAFQSKCLKEWQWECWIKQSGKPDQFSVFEGPFVASSKDELGDAVLLQEVNRKYRVGAQ